MLMVPSTGKSILTQDMQHSLIAELSPSSSTLMKELSTGMAIKEVHITNGWAVFQVIALWFSRMKVNGLTLYC